MFCCHLFFQTQTLVATRHAAVQPNVVISHVKGKKYLIAVLEQRRTDEVTNITSKL